jgi:hypothetical protein
MTDLKALTQALDALAEELEPSAAAAEGLRTRGPVGVPRGEESILQLVERDGVLHVQEIDPKAVRRVRGGSGDEGVRYERRFERLDRSRIGDWLERLDRKLTPQRGLRALGDDGLEPLARFPEKGRILLLIHGTFSESASFFDGFQQNPQGPAFLDWARGHYSQVITFDHPTLAVSPILNARELALRIGPSQAEIDVVCHSRGGLVTRWWLEAFDRAPPERRRAVFVGAPLAGTGLASPANLRGSLSLLANIGSVLGAASAGVPFLAVMTGLFGILTSVTRLGASTPALDAAVALVPGLFAQSRVGNNAELLSLRQGPQRMDGRYFAVQSNFESESPGWRFWRAFRQPHLVDSLADLVFAGHNDLVVDTGSMTDLADALSIPAGQVLDFGTSDAIHHTNYFAQAATLGFIQARLGQRG